MSQVSHVLMMFSAAEQPARIVDVNQFFISAGYMRGLVSIEDEALPPGWYGGNKPFEAEVLVGAFNFLEADSFIAHVEAIPWDDNASVPARAGGYQVSCLQLLKRQTGVIENPST